MQAALRGLLLATAVWSPLLPTKLCAGAETQQESSLHHRNRHHAAHKRHHLRRHAQHHRRHSWYTLGSEQEVEEQRHRQTPTSAQVTGTVAETNHQISQLRESLDQIVLECKVLLESHTEEISDLDHEIAHTTASINGNAGEQLDSTNAFETSNYRLDHIQDHYTLSEALCKEEDAQLRAQITAVQSDMVVIQDMERHAGECRTMTSLVAGCKTDGPKIVPALVSLNRQAARLRSGLARQEFQEALRMLHSGKKRSRLWPPDTRPNRCAIGERSEASCEQFKGLVHSIAGRLSDQADNLNVASNDNMQGCIKHLQQTMLESSTQKQKNMIANEDLSRSVAEKATLTTEGDDLRLRRHRLQQELAELQDSCTSRQQKADVQIADAKSLRQSVLEQENGGEPVDLVQDCEVSDWTWGACSTTCKMEGSAAAGTRMGSRLVLIPSGENGSPCPSLSTSMECGKSICPRDCVLGEWEGWSACSKACDGGTQMRTRPVVESAANDGLQCSSLEERRACNVGACDVDCELGEWGGWSACSRGCKFSEESLAGSKFRVREVLQPPKGLGTCPSEQDPERRELEQCNEDLCLGEPTCVAEQDIFLLLDGSGPANFTAQQILAREFVARSEASVSFAIAAYGEEITSIAAFDATRAELLSQISSAAKPGGQPDLVQGEALAANMLKQRPMDHEKVVVLIADGSLLNFNMAEKSGQELRSAGFRVVVGFIDYNDPEAREQACTLASSPCEGNLDAVSSWEQMASQPERFLVTACSSLRFHAPAASSLTAINSVVQKQAMPATEASSARPHGYSLLVDGVTCSRTLRLSQSHAGSEKDCFELCADDADCSYFTYRADGRCAQFRDCPTDGRFIPNVLPAKTFQVLA